MKKKITVNEMILNTIWTKMPKEPKYKSILEQLGYEVFDNDWSSQKYWAVREKGDKGEGVCVSKDYENTTAYFGGSVCIRWPRKSERAKQVGHLIDFQGFLKKRNYANRPARKQRMPRYFRQKYMYVPVCGADDKYLGFKAYPEGSKIGEYFLVKERMVSLRHSLRNFNFEFKSVEERYLALKKQKEDTENSLAKAQKDFDKFLQEALNK